MCTIAGYNGTKPAAPILIDMMRKLEGLDSGFYTGIATIHEGKIYHAKVAGDLDRLLETTDAANLPGTIGFIHSRTPANHSTCRNHRTNRLKKARRFFAAGKRARAYCLLIARKYTFCRADGALPASVI